MLRSVRGIQPSNDATESKHRSQDIRNLHTEVTFGWAFRYQRHASSYGILLVLSGYALLEDLAMADKPVLAVPKGECKYLAEPIG